MKNVLRHLAIAGLAAIFVICGYRFCGECAAGTPVLGTDKLDRNLAAAIDDVRFYQIISKSDKGKDYISYCRLIREKIRQRLNISYGHYDKRGDVRLLFTLGSDGSLLSLDASPISPIPDERLINIAASSIKKAAPFPPFPGSLNFERMPFSVVISFEES